MVCHLKVVAATYAKDRKPELSHVAKLIELKLPHRFHMCLVSAELKLLKLVGWCVLKHVTLLFSIYNFSSGRLKKKEILKYLLIDNIPIM